MAETSIIGIGTSILTIFLLFIIVKQIIGLPGYTIYYPLLAALAWIVVRPFVDIKIIAIMLITEKTGWFIQKQLTRRYISLLLYPRQAFYAGISTLLLIFSRWLASRRNLIDRRIDEISVWYISLIYALILFIAPKVFGQGKGIFSFHRWVHNMRFITLTILCSYIVTHAHLLQLSQSYPFICIIIFLLCIIFGRYQWLQLMEMMRFRKLIRSKKIQHNKYTNK